MSTEHDFTKCIVCAREIPKLAKKCTHCGSYQNWRRHISGTKELFILGGAIFALVIAAVQGVYRYYDYVQNEKRAQFSFSVLSINYDYLEIIVSNNTNNVIVVDAALCNFSIFVNPDEFLIAANTRGKTPLTVNSFGPFVATYIFPFRLSLKPEETVEATLYLGTMVAFIEDEVTAFQKELPEGSCSLIGQSAERGDVPSYAPIDLGLITRFDPFETLDRSTILPSVQIENLKALLNEIR